MKTMIITCGLVVASSVTAFPVDLEVGVGHAEVNGLRRYAAARFLRTGKTDRVTVPMIRASMSIGERLFASLGYSYIGSLKGAGVAPSSDIFEEGGPALTVITPFESSEKIHELSLGISYRIRAGQNLRIELGPEASLFHSRASIAYRSFSEEDIGVGGRVEARYPINDNWSVSVGYRLVAPPSRTVNIFSLAIGCAQ